MEAAADVVDTPPGELPTASRPWGILSLSRPSHEIPLYPGISHYIPLFSSSCVPTCSQQQACGARLFERAEQLTSAAPGDPGFEAGLEATRSETANDNAEHGVMLRGAMPPVESELRLLDRGVASSRDKTEYVL